MFCKWKIVSLALCLPVAILAANPSVKSTGPDKAPQREQQQKANKQNANAAARESAKAQTQVTRQQAQATQQALNPPVLPGGLTLQRLAQMSADERAAVLGKLPPARQQQIEKRLENYRNIPAEERALAERQAERLKALPPDRYAAVRQSATAFRDIDAPRKTVIIRELNFISTLTDEQRAAYMNKANFRGRFSANEIEMINNLREIIP